MSNNPKEIIDSVGKIADNLTTTREEEEGMRSNRHALDMASDSFLSKSIRPFVLIFLLLMFTALSLIDMLTDYKINDSFSFLCWLRKISEKELPEIFKGKIDVPYLDPNRKCLYKEMGS